MVAADADADAGVEKVRRVRTETRERGRQRQRWGESSNVRWMNGWASPVKETTGASPMS